MLLVFLMRYRQNFTQQYLAVASGVDQSTISRYLRFTIRILKKFLPTALRITKKIRSIETKRELARIIPGQTIIIDGSHVEIERPTNKEDRKDAYSGKKKKCTFNTNFVTNEFGLIIAISVPFVGSTHDMTMTREDPLDFGKWSESMEDPKTKKQDRIKIRADRGYTGLDAIYPGADIEIPEKRKKGEELTEEQKASNKEKNQRRAIIENMLAMIKQWKRMAGRYNGSADTFAEELEVITGLVNMRLLWDEQKKRPKLDF